MVRSLKLTELSELLYAYGCSVASYILTLCSLYEVSQSSRGAEGLAD